MPKKPKVKQVAVNRKPAVRKRTLLRDAPAQETIYTIRTINPVPVDLDLIRASLIAALKDEFPHAEDFNAFQTTIQQPASEAPAVNTEKRAMGFRFKSADGTHVAHFMHDGLVVNWVKASYPLYEKSINRMQRFWDLYESHFNPIGVDHVALRYINQLQLPLHPKKVLRFSDYIKNGPNLPEIEGLAFNGFQHYAELVKLPEGIRSRVMTATLNPTDDTLPLLFDYEAFVQLKEKERREPKAIWQAIDQAHTWCGTFFKQTLTSKCHALFS
jgi:uncharacterized protein (TIGR04255 family)